MTDGTNDRSSINPGSVRTAAATSIVFLEIRHLSDEQRVALKAVSTVLPFRVNDYVLRELIDWDDIPNDPHLSADLSTGGDARSGRLPSARRYGCQGRRRRASAAASCSDIHHANEPESRLARRSSTYRWSTASRCLGCQHKYRETVLFFPVQGQTCHAYCTYCFRWAQFVGDKDLRFAARDVEQLVRYLREHDEVTDVLITGGDPMVMSAGLLRRRSNRCSIPRSSTCGRSGSAPSR